MAKAVNSPLRSRLLPTQPWKVCRSGRSRKCHDSVTYQKTPWHRAERGLDRRRGSGPGSLRVDSPLDSRSRPSLTLTILPLSRTGVRTATPGGQTRPPCHRLPWHHQPTSFGETEVRGGLAPGRAAGAGLSWGGAGVPRAGDRGSSNPSAGGTVRQSKNPWLMGEAEPANQRDPAGRGSLPIRGAGLGAAEMFGSCLWGARRDARVRGWELRLPLSTPFLSCLSFPGNER
nr:PREDICTED: uncharacterized protein LOC103541304 [Equus przewalskii]